MAKRTSEKKTAAKKSSEKKISAKKSSPKKSSGKKDSGKKSSAKKTDKGSDIPSTIQRSGKKARETWAKAHDSAVDSYGDGERAHRTAFSALKHTHEKVGDHWEPKKEYGPSDEQAATGNRSSDKPTAGGVDANASKKHLLEVARRLDVKGRSTMDKKELVDAIRKANERATAKARS